MFRESFTITQRKLEIDKRSNKPNYEYFMNLDTILLFVINA